MYEQNRSGQSLYFALVSAISGNPVTGQATGISGRVSLDGGAAGVVAGPISEVGGGQYLLGLFAADINARVAGFLFTASGCVPVNYTVPTFGNVSGKVNVASGASVTAAPYSGSLSGQLVSVFSGSLSGQVVTAASGAFSQVASGTTYLASGSPVVPYSGQLSGQSVTANVTQWLGVTPNALIASGRLDAAFNVRTGVARSGTAGTIQLDAGVPTGVSGVYDGAVVTLVGGTGAGRSRTISNMGSSGVAFVSPNWDASGVPDTTTIYTLTPGAQAFSGQVQIASGPSVVASLNSGQQVVPYSGQLSGQLVTAASGAFTQVASGTTFLASGSVTSGVICSGVFVTATATIASGALSGQVVSLLSGTTFLASGSVTSGVFCSGQFVNAATTVASGLSVVATIYSGQLSGQVVTPQSGVTFLASGSVTSGVICSGVFVTATASVASGQVYLASGSAVNLLSGNVTAPYSGSLSGQVVTAASGASVIVPSGLSTISTLYSGQQTVPYSGQMSGQQVQTLTNLDKSGYTAGSVSGTTYLASGSPVVPYSGSLSGQQVSSFSGANVIVPSGLSTVASLYSGQLSTPYSGSLSGQQVQVLTNLDKSGYIASLLSGNLATVAGFLSGAAKSILIEGAITAGTQLVNDSGAQLTSIDLPQAVAAILATQAGTASGGGTTSFVIRAGGNPSSANRVSATVDASGNRTAVNLKVPN